MTAAGKRPRPGRKPRPRPASAPGYEWPELRVRVSPEVHTALRAWADTEDRTLANAADRLLRQALGLA